MSSYATVVWKIKNFEEKYYIQSKVKNRYYFDLVMRCSDKSFGYHSQKIAGTDGPIDCYDIDSGCSFHNSLNLVILAPTFEIQVNLLDMVRKVGLT
jgi:hypothetical protein